MAKDEKVVAPRQPKTEKVVTRRQAKEDKTPVRRQTREEKGRLARMADGIRNYFRETIGELRKVNWPTWKEAKNLTTVVLVVLVIMSSILGFLDILFSRLFDLILKLAA